MNTNKRFNTLHFVCFVQRGKKKGHHMNEDNDKHVEDCRKCGTVTWSLNKCRINYDESVFPIIQLTKHHETETFTSRDINCMKHTL